jgi:hypothetical protein
MLTKALMIITGVIKHIGRLTKCINHYQWLTLYAVKLANNVGNCSGSLST